MFLLKSEIQFDAAHYLSGYEGKCRNIHGHRYRLIAELARAELIERGSRRGMVEDFSALKCALQEIVSAYDHKLLAEDDADGRAVARALEALPDGFEVALLPFRPTAEELAREIYRQLKAEGYPVVSVELFETPGNSCIYREG